MTDTPTPEVTPDVLPPESNHALTSPPPVPPKKIGFLRRIFTSRKKQRAVAMQNGYLEMVDLIRAIRAHLDRQETVQSSVLAMLEKVPDTMDRQQEVMQLFKQHLESGMENNRRLTDSMGNLNHTLASMDEAHRASSRTVTDLIHRSRESEQLLREVMRRAERRMAVLLIVFTLFVLGLGYYFARGMRPRAAVRPDSAKPAAVHVVPTKAKPESVPAQKPVEPAAAKSDPVKKEKPSAAPSPQKKEKVRKEPTAKSTPKADVKKETPVAEAPAPAKELADEPKPAQIVIELKPSEAIAVTAPVVLEAVPEEPAAAKPDPAKKEKPSAAPSPQKKEKAHKAPTAKSTPKSEAALSIPEAENPPPPAADAAP